MTFHRRSLAHVMPLLLNNHYLARRTADPMFVFTWETDKVVACAVFCAPCNRYFGKGAVELSRLVRLDECTEPMTKFLSLCMAELRRDTRKLKYLLSYADSTVGHHGGVYQAFNGIHVAVSKGHSLWKNKEGKVISNRSPVKSFCTFGPYTKSESIYSSALAGHRYRSLNRRKLYDSAYHV